LVAPEVAPELAPEVAPTVCLHNYTPLCIFIQDYTASCKQFVLSDKTARVFGKTAAVFTKTTRVFPETRAVLSVYLCNIGLGATSDATSGATSGATNLFVMASDFQRVKCQV